MTSLFCRVTLALTAIATFTVLPGCNKADTPARNSQTQTSEVPNPSAESLIQLTSGQDDGTDGGVTPAAYTQETSDPFHEQLSALQPLQTLVGTWQGVTQRAISGAKAIESPLWNWDFLTNPEEPALVLASKSSPYLRLARLTYRPQSRAYQLFVTSANGSERIFEGSFVESPKETTGADSSLQRSFKLRLVQMTPKEHEEVLVLCQQTSNRYVLEVHRKAGEGVALYDTVEAVREGTGVLIDQEAVSRQPCVVSGGVGSTSLIFEGKTYFVCCDGCKAAFMADPSRWVEEHERRQVK